MTESPGFVSLLTADELFAHDHMSWQGAQRPKLMQVLDLEAWKRSDDNEYANANRRIIIYMLMHVVG